jgi:hypothetical protein
MNKLERIVDAICKKRSVSKAKIAKELGMERNNFYISVENYSMSTRRTFEMMEKFGVGMDIYFKDNYVKNKKDENSN